MILISIFTPWFKHNILFRRNGLGAAYNATVPSTEFTVYVRYRELKSMKNRLCSTG